VLPSDIIFAYYQRGSKRMVYSFAALQPALDMEQPYSLSIK